MKKTVVFLILVSVVAAAGYYGSTWYGSHQMLKGIKAEVGDVGVLEWQSIEPDWTGKVKVGGLRFTVFELSQPMRIEEALFDAGSPQNLLSWLFKPKAGLPALAQLTLSQVQLILRPDLTKSWVSTVSEDSLWPRPWHLRACGEHTRLTAADLMTMGIDTVDLDIDLRWKRGGGEAATIHGEINAGALGSVDFTLSEQNLPADPTRWSADFPKRWQALQLVVRDGGFMRRLGAFCSKDRYASPEAWAEAETERLLTDLARWGISPGPQLRALHTQWLHSGGALMLELPATGSQSLESLAALSDYLQQDSLVALYNDRRVGDISLSLDAKDFAARMQPPAPAPTPAPVTEDSTAWRDTPPGSLDQWLDRQVRVTLASGRSLEGRLSAINERQLQVARIVDGGEFATSARREDVVTLEVWRRRSEVPVVTVEPQAAAVETNESLPANDGSDESEGAAAEPIY